MVPAAMVDATRRMSAQFLSIRSAFTLPPTSGPPATASTGKPRRRKGCTSSTGGRGEHADRVQAVEAALADGQSAWRRPGGSLNPCAAGVQPPPPRWRRPQAGGFLQPACVSLLFMRGFSGLDVAVYTRIRRTWRCCLCVDETLYSQRLVEKWPVLPCCSHRAAPLRCRSTCPTTRPATIYEAVEGGAGDAE